MDIGLPANIPTNTGGGGGGLGPILLQVVTSLLAGVALYFLLGAVEAAYSYANRLSLNRTDLLPITYSTEDKSYTIEQNPNVQGANPVHRSDNERSGPEFTYSFFVNVHPSTFRQEQGLLHIFHKGSPGQYPLLGPGVYMRSETNTLRVYMNTFETWNRFVEVENFPIGKWVHVALVCKANCLEVYINGNLKSRLDFNGYSPYQNYQNICCFSQRRITLPTTIPSVGSAGFNVFGVMKGLFSRMTYFSYALSYSEINSLMNQGPSSKLASSQGGMTAPYLDDSWWTSSY
jgi:hypothetical protein